jgi:membrane fusion protein, macrolide-specific efflux system
MKIFAALSVMALSFAVGFYWMKNKSPDQIYRPVLVKKGDLKVTVISTGVVAPENRVDLKAPIPGRAEEVLVEEGDKVKRGQVLLWMSSTERAALVDAARAKSMAEYRHWQDYYRPTPVIAPIDGTIILRSVEPGQTFTANDPILGMSDRLTVQAQVDETDLAMVKAKKPAKIVLDAYPDVSIPARVVRVAYDATTVNNVTMYTVVVLPDKIPDFMRSGMTANVTFEIESKDDVLLVPNESIKMVDGAPTVSRAKLSGPEVIAITMGTTDGINTEVVSGLQDGDVVLIRDFKYDPVPLNMKNPLSKMMRRQPSGR